MSSDNSQRIITWLNKAPSEAYSKKEFVRGFEVAKVRLSSNDTKLSCPHCLLIPRFPLVLKCGHVSCHRCFPEWYKSSRHLKCIYCQAPVILEEVMTLHDDHLKRPGSIAWKMYDLAMITCTNNGCNKEFSFAQINNHEFYECAFRIVKCPAINCHYKDNPNEVHKHALECPFLSFYCSTCYGEYGAEVLSHSCTKRLQRHLADLVHSHAGLLPTLPNHRTGDVILPSHVDYTPFDIDALIDEQLGQELLLSPMSSVRATRRRVLVRKLAYPHGLDETYWRSDNSENNISQFNFN